MPLGRLLRSQSQLQEQAASPHAGHGAQQTSQGQRIARRYQYDLAGQLLGIDDRRNGSTRYGYDALGRLLSAQPPQASEVLAFAPGAQPDGPRANPSAIAPGWLTMRL